MQANTDTTDDNAVMLAQQADRLEPEDAKGTQSWDRAKVPHGASDLKVEGRSLGRIGVQLPDSDTLHECLIVQAPDGTTAGACDCEGWSYQDYPCAHLSHLLILESLDNVNLDTSAEYVAELLSDAQSSEHRAEGDDTGEDTDDPAPAPEPAEPATPARDDAFAEPMPDVDDRFVMNLNGDTYIRKAGYARLLHQAGLTVKSVEVVGAHETEWTRAKYRAQIVNGDGEVVAQQVGTAGPPDKEGLADAEMHLDELAETRAWTRAAALATGEGMTALAEVPGVDAQ